MKKVALVLLFVSQFASAATWYTVNAFGGRTYQVDLDSIADVSGYKKIWTRELLNNEEKVPSNTFYSYAKQISLWYYDCKKKMTSVPAAYYYGKDGSPVSNDVRQFSPSQMSDIIPESLGEDIGKIVCDFDAKKIAAMRKSVSQPSGSIVDAVNRAIQMAKEPSAKKSAPLPGLPPTADMVKDWKDIPSAAKE